MTNRVNAKSTETIRERFEKFHRENPEVYTELVELARELVRRGYTKFGIATIYEVARWRSMLRAERPADEFKLNNNWRAHYARLIMSREPDLASIFDIRTLGEPHHVAP